MVVHSQSPGGKLETVRLDFEDGRKDLEGQVLLPSGDGVRSLLLQ